VHEAGSPPAAGHLLLPPGYSENLPDPRRPGYWTRQTEIDASSPLRYHDSVYRFAAHVAPPAPNVIVDIGCASGANLVRHLGDRARTVGIDHPRPIARAREQFPERAWVAADLRWDELWSRLNELRPDLVICADLVQRVEDPLELLERLRVLVRDGGTLVLSTPDRDKLEGQPPLGPPRRKHNLREWSFPEMNRLLGSVGFSIESSRHVRPHRYPIRTREARLATWRAVRGRRLPGSRSCMVFELVSR
jgi:SAM-dependent methyltransferase